ncbi:MAG: hypothetical protein HDP34_06235 [Clostridia bacterium]|nr:hypothetical protein [Clostridia bacterium]
MTQETQDALEILKRKMQGEIKPILFTGAGFSFQAKNVYGREMPLGNTLKEWLLTELLCLDKDSDIYKDLISNSLDDIYGYAKNSNEAQAVGFLLDIFSNVKPEPHHQIVANFPWQRVYTVNIDDLFEKAFSNGTLNVINSATSIPTKYRSKLEYIKLHGCVNNKDAGFIFSKEEYQKKISGKLDHRFAKLVEDLQTQDFIFIGTSGNESDISAYLLKYGVPENSGRGNIYIVNPKPSVILRDQINKSGAHLIEMTCKEFAAWMDGNISFDKFKFRNTMELQRFNKNFLNVGRYLKAHSSDDNSRTRLYLGDNPTWLDITTDYDFRTPSSLKILHKIDNLIKDSKGNIIFTILSKAIGGKSVHLKRIGLDLLKKGYDLYEFIGSELNSDIFITVASASHNDIVVLLIDNASGYYATISNILESFPDNKRLIIIVTARPYFHYKKYYDLRHFPTYTCFDIDERQDSSYFASVGSSAVETLKNKGLLGKLRRFKDDEARIKEFVKHKDICASLWSLFHGSDFKKRFESSYSSIIDLISKESDPAVGSMTKDLLLALALFNRQDLPYLPDTLLFSWMDKYSHQVQNKLGDITKRIEPHGISMRIGFLTNTIIHKASETEKLRVVDAILRNIAPHIAGSRDSYWHQIQSRIMNESFLHNSLKIDIKKVSGLFSQLLRYYEEDENYFLQLGKIEQRMGQYEIALNHFQQAEELAPNYYNVHNAKARNYLLQSYRDRRIDRETAKEYYRIGSEIMLNLIAEKERYQVRAYSVHSLTVESVNYWRRWKINPSKDELTVILNVLKDACEEFPDDKRTDHACNFLMSFIQLNKLGGRLPNDNDFKLRMLKASSDNSSNYEDDDITL